MSVPSSESRELSRSGARGQVVDVPRPRSLLITVEEVAELWFGTVGEGGSASSNCQKIRRLIPHALPARRIGNRWYVSRAVAEEWVAGSDPASAMAHPDSRTSTFPEHGDGACAEGNS